MRNNALVLEDAFLETDRITQKNILGDDDILGFRRINKEKLSIYAIYNFFGTHKLDRYEYELKFINITGIN